MFALTPSLSITQQPSDNEAELDLGELDEDNSLWDDSSGEEDDNNEDGEDDHPSGAIPFSQYGQANPYEYSRDIPSPPPPPRRRSYDSEIEIRRRSPSSGYYTTSSRVSIVEDDAPAKADIAKWIGGLSTISKNKAEGEEVGFDELIKKFAHKLAPIGVSRPSRSQ